jgi:hypothetical protein
LRRGGLAGAEGEQRKPREDRTGWAHRGASAIGAPG